MMLRMPGTNLTRDEAAERARLLSVDSYTVDLDLTRSETTFDSTTVLRFSCTEPGASTFADLVDASIKQLSLNGRDLDLSAYSDSRIRLDDLAADNELRVVAECPYSRTGEGMHRFVDPADNRVYLYTQFEVPDARRVFTTFEQPDLKATFQFTVTAPSGWQVVSNSPTPEPEPVSDGLSVWRFAPTLRMSTYITAVVAGEYAVVRDSYTGAGGEIPLGIFCRQSLREHLDSDDIFEITRQGFEFFESAFDYPYPFGKYDQLFVPEYNMGAMENAGCVTFRDEYIYRSRQTVAAYESRANTILHEMAHMWFGDLVTMRWWDDLWLNESFAEWASHHSMVHATRFTEGWTGFSNARKGWAYRQDQLPSTHPIAADNADLEAVEVNFDGITYAKGASSLRQLVAWVGEEHFVSGLRTYFRDHAFGNTDLHHLMDALEAASGRDLESWTKEWLQTSGVNTLRARFETGDDGAFTSFVVEQSAHPDFPTLRRHRIAVGLYDHEGSRLVLRDSIEADISGAETDLPELVGVKRPDLVLLNDQDLSYAKIRLDSESLNTLTEHIHQIDDSLARALCWGAAWDMTRDAEMRASDFLTLVLAGVGTETDMTAVASLLRQATTAVHLFAAPGEPGHAGGALGGRAALAAARRGVRQRSPAGPGARVRAGGPLTAGARPDRGAADRGGQPARVGGRRRPALDARLGPGPDRPLRRGRDRRRARARQHHLRAGERGGRAGDASGRGGEAPGVGGRGRTRRRGQRDAALHRRVVPGARPGRAAAAVRRHLPRRGAPRLGGQGRPASHDHPAVPVPAGASPAGRAGEGRRVARRRVGPGGRAPAGRRGPLGPRAGARGPGVRRLRLTWGTPPAGGSHTARHAVRVERQGYLHPLEWSRRPTTRRHGLPVTAWNLCPARRPRPAG
jgi:aminopeptidase N